MFYGSRGHLESFSGNFLVLIFLSGMPSHIPGEKFDIQRSNIWINNRQTLSAFSGDSHDLESPGTF